ncbi:MAG: Stp1/IreP family PP2C-type Ser/Thr phosphatase [Acidimicrobiales bacterium]
MTANWRRKRRVRVRMAKTGESYSAALRHLRETKEMDMPEYEVRRGGATDVGNVRPTNQDFLLLDEELFAVADGLGGLPGGEVASRLAVDALREAFAEDPTATGLVEAAHQANRVVWEHGAADPDLRGMGTTLTAAALVKDRGDFVLAIVNVGDSRAYLLHDGALNQLTADHSLVGDLVRAGELTVDDARAHPRRNVLTRAVGIGPTVDADLFRAVPTRGDRLLLCSDGLVNEVGDDEITDILSRTVDPAEAADELVQAAKDHGGKDNITTVVLDIA